MAAVVAVAPPNRTCAWRATSMPFDWERIPPHAPGVPTVAIDGSASSPRASSSSDVNTTGEDSVPSRRSVPKTRAAPVASLTITPCCSVTSVPPSTSKLPGW